MADPIPYERTYSFTDFQAGNPSAPLPGIQVDNELENIEQSLGGAIDAIKDVRRSDGKLKNGIVTVDSLSPQVAAGVGAGALAAAEAAAAYAHFAARWASAPEGQDVDDGVNPVSKSAYHWSLVALGAATGALPDGSVTTPKLADEAVTEEKLAAEVADKLNIAYEASFRPPELIDGGIYYPTADGSGPDVDGGGY